MRSRSIAFAAALTLVACGASDGAGGAAPLATPATPTTTEPTEPLGSADEPPDVVVVGADGPMNVDIVTYCWTIVEGGEEVGICADGELVEPLPDVGVLDGELQFGFDLAGWTFVASLADDVMLTNETRLAVTPLDATTWTVDLSPLDGSGIVTLFGRGPEGDVFTAVRATSEGGESSAPGAGAVTVVEVVDRCADGVSVLIDDRLYLLDGELRNVTVPNGRAWETGDFPEYWSVEIYNAKPVDGDGWAIFDALATTVDERTIEVADGETGDTYSAPSCSTRRSCRRAPLLRLTRQPQHLGMGPSRNGLPSPPCTCSCPRSGWKPPGRFAAATRISSPRSR